MQDSRTEIRQMEGRAAFETRNTSIGKVFRAKMAGNARWCKGLLS